MPTLDVIATLLVLTALGAWVNQRYLRLPMAIGVMVVSLLASLLLIVAGAIDPSPLTPVHRALREMMQSIDLHSLIMDGMLSLLLFAGALHVDLKQLRTYAMQIFGLAVLGTLLSTVIVAFLTYQVLGLLGVSLPLVFCIAFGALISPTDPIAVLGVLKAAKVPKAVETAITGESLFNDGVAVVLMTLLLDVIQQGSSPSLREALTLFGHEAGGGIALGLVLGFVCYRMLKSIDEYQVEVLITLATVFGGYLLAHRLHVSGPLAMVVCGLLVGEYGRAEAMTDITRQQVDTFWELMDVVLNALLFLLIGLEVMVLPFHVPLLLAGGCAIVITLFARAMTVGLPVALMPVWFKLPKGSAKVLTWCGVRGGVSVALALALPDQTESETVVVLTYVVVIFSILVQGLTVARVARGLKAV